MTKTLGFASPIAGIPKGSAFFLPWYVQSVVLNSICSLSG
jgi:hypothetical protein